MDNERNQFNRPIQHYSCHSVTSLEKILDDFDIISVWQSQQETLNSDHIIK